MYVGTKQEEHPFTLYGSQSKEMGSDRRCLRIRRFLVDVKTSKTRPHTIDTNEQRLDCFRIPETGGIDRMMSVNTHYLVRT